MTNVEITLVRSSTNTSSTTTEEIPPPDSSNDQELKLSLVSQFDIKNRS